jgi:hypothetical protein
MELERFWEWITDKTECEKSKLFKEKLWIPDIVENMLSWLTELLPTWIADAWLLSGMEGFSNAKSWSYCVWVKDSEVAWRWDWILWLFWEFWNSESRWFPWTWSAEENYT